MVVCKLPAKKFWKTGEILAFPGYRLMVWASAAADQSRPKTRAIQRGDRRRTAILLWGCMASIVVAAA